MNTNAALYEIESIDKEIIGLKGEIKKIRRKISQLEARRTELQVGVFEKIKSSDDNEYVYNGKAYRIEEKVQKVPKPIKKKKEDVIQALNDSGVVVERESELAAKIAGALKSDEKIVLALKR